VSRSKDNLQIYGPPALAVVLFAIAIAQYVWIGQWERLLVPMACAALGFVCAIASHEVADWTGSYRWTYDTYWTYPPTWVRTFGWMVLVYVDVFGFRR
jgi:hypothetical protein